MQILNNISLKPYNTFGIHVKAKRFVEIKNKEEFSELLNIEKDFFLLGGGSNLLLTQDIDKLVVKINTKGKEVIKTNDTSVQVKIQAGEVWHEFVLWSIEHHFGGIENLALIPGNVGTTPIQNIGAYGVEVKDTIYEVEALEIKTNTTHIFSAADCKFEYRNSIFKNEAKGKYIITSVTFKLTIAKHQLNSSYGAIQSELEKQDIKNPTLKNISDAIIAIRQRKLPDPAELGNSGSFFKNPVISKEYFKNLQNKYPQAPHYIISENQIKIPAGWMVEQCGFKGKRFGDAGVHKNQALVLVNYGTATGLEIKQLSERIQQSVLDKFGIAIETEVNIF